MTAARSNRPQNVNRRFQIKLPYFEKLKNKQKKDFIQNLDSPFRRFKEEICDENVSHTVVYYIYS